MANKVLAFLEKAGKEVEVVAVDVVTGSEDAIKILADSKTLAPEVKAGIQTLIADGEALSTSVLVVTASQGGNWTADAVAVAGVEKLVKDFIAFLPTLKAAALKIEADIK